MADPKGFLKHARTKEKERPVADRVRAWGEFAVPPAAEELAAQAARCMDCGIPFCHQGCPLGNLVPEWNDHVYRGRADAAAVALLATNNFPEVTGRVCPAPCEAACVLNIDGAPVSIKMVEKAIAETVSYAPVVAAARTGRRVAVVGSGPAGLAAAQQLARAGHDVTVLERDDRVGGLLRYGIPDFKMEKGLLDRRAEQMRAEGVTFLVGVDVGVAPSVAELRASYDAVVLAVGARAPRDLPIPGRALAGVHFAMEFLTQQNKRVAGDGLAGGLVATGKDVVVIGGGDTGSDCVGTSVRQGARRVVQLELLPKPALVRAPQNPWPEWPLVLRTSSSQEEAEALAPGEARDWSVMTTAFTGDGRVEKLRAVRVERKGGRFEEVPGSAFDIPCDLALLAMGFVGPEASPLVAGLGLELDARGNVVTDAAGRTSAPGVFAAGDASRGQSLVVWAIADGRRVAAGVDAFLRGGALARSA